MMLLNCGVALLAVAATTTVPAHAPAFSPRQPLHSQPAAMYTSHQMEAYLTAEQVAYIRPGFNITLVSFQIPDDRKPIAEVKFTDDNGQPLDRLGNVTPGAISASFVLSWYDAANRDYVNYTPRVQTSPITGVSASQSSADSGGTWTQLALGDYTYKFGKTLPTGYDKTKTHTIGIYGARSLTSIIGKDYYSNVLNDFRPDGGPVTDKWAAIATSTCNGCHDPLSAHGGSRYEVKLCALCHNHTQSLDPDTGNVVELRVMIHKIHDGPNLPSVQAGHPYQIIGFNQAVNDFSDTTYPQDIRNCATCHRADAPEGYIWYTNPSRGACGSCHDDIDWVTGANHVAGPQADDGACKYCHQPQGESEFDASIKGAHTIETKSAQLKGLNLQITGVTNTNPGSSPIITFKVTNGDGSFVDPKTLARLRFNIGGPTTDYTQSITADANNTSSVCNGSGVCTFTYTKTIPASATGSWVATADCYRSVQLNPGPATAVREAAKNPIFYFPVTDAQVMARRTVVTLDKCNKCHETLALHGGQRFKVEECVVCHNPTATAAVTAGGPNQGIHLKWMVHHIHTGENLERPYVIGSTGFNEVTYPGDRRDCEACHATGTYTVPLPDGVLPTSTPSDFVTSWAPTAAACLSCHDGADAAAHAYMQTAPWGESCEVCHGEDAEFAVTKVHAR
jgi:OmcA/MtrC family decaheme c-type cytochrome